MRVGSPARPRSGRPAGAGVGIAVLLACLLAGIPPAAADARSASLREEVRVLLRRGERKPALEKARDAVAADGADVEAHVLYQEAARGQVPAALLVEEYRTLHANAPGDGTLFLLARLLPPAEAEPRLKEFLAKNPGAYWAQVGLGATLARAGKGAESEALALAALAGRAGDPDAAARSGALCAEARRFAAAEACYRKALEAAPAHDGATLGLAHALLRQGKAAEAAKVLDGRPAAGPADLRVLLLRAAIAAEKGDSAAEEAALVAALAMDAQDAETKLALGVVRVRRTAAKAAAEKRAAKPEEFAADLGQVRAAAAALADRADVQYSLGHALEAAGLVDEARAAYTEASRLDPLGSASLTSLGALHLQRGELEDAVRELKRALDRDGKDTEALLAMAQALERLDRGKDALETLQRLVKVAPGDARGWHALGLVAESAGRLPDAAAAFKKAAELDAGTARYHRDYGETLFQAKKFDQAAEALEKGLAIDPSDARAWTALARSRTQQRKYDRAAEAYEKVVALRPDDQNLHVLLGALYQEYLHEYERALIHYHKFRALGGEDGNVEDWIAECEAEMAKKKK